MKGLKVGALAMIMAVTALSANAGNKDKNKEKQVYAYGMASSFNDSIVYFTHIQPLDSVRLHKGFLLRREAYSYQLGAYVENVIGKPYYTTVTFFSENKDKLYKKAMKLVDKYRKSKGVVVEEIPSDKFKYTKPE